MIIEAKKLKNGTLINKYEVRLECVHCGMEVDAEEYKSGTCSDCGKEWAEKKHVGVCDERLCHLNFFTISSFSLFILHFFFFFNFGSYG